MVTSGSVRDVDDRIKKNDPNASHGDPSACGLRIKSLSNTEGIHSGHGFIGWIPEPCFSENSTKANTTGFFKKSIPSKFSFLYKMNDDKLTMGSAFL
jgi:hypothetical protein